MNHLPVKKETNSKQVIFRSFLLLTSMIFLFLITFSTSLYAGVRSGELNTRILKPIKEKVDVYYQFWEAVNSISDDTNNNQEIFDEATSSAEDSTGNISPTPVKTQDNTQYAYPTYVAPKYNYPTYTLHEYPTPTSFNFPTPKPGELGSPEWKAKFDQEFQAAKDAQAKFCKDNPDLCK